MQINYQLSEEDLIEFYMFHMQYDRRAIRARIFQTLIGCLILSILTFTLINRTRVNLVKGWTIGIVVMVLFSVLYQVFFRAMMRRRIVALLKKNHPYDTYGEKSMVFEKDYLMETTGGLKRKLFYKDILRSVETKDYFYIYEAPGVAYTIPKRSLSLKMADGIREALKMTTPENGKDPLKENLFESLRKGRK